MSDLNFDYLQGAYGVDSDGICPSNSIDPRLDEIFAWPPDRMSNQPSGAPLRLTAVVAEDQSANYRHPSAPHAVPGQHSAHNIPTYPEIASGASGASGARKRRRPEPQTPRQVTPRENSWNTQRHTSQARTLAKPQVHYVVGPLGPDETDWFRARLMYHLTNIYLKIRDEMVFEGYPRRRAVFYMRLSERTNINQENDESGARSDTQVEHET